MRYRLLSIVLVLVSCVPPGIADERAPGSVADPATYLDEFCELAAMRWPANRTLRIVCHGHSVPAGYFRTPEVRTFDSYPHLLHVRLKESFPHAVLNVVVTAIGGENSVSGAARFERDVLALRPDIITIDYGLNDRRVGLEGAGEAWESMITQAQAHGTKVLLLTPTPDTASDLSDPADPLNLHAEQIRSLARKHGTALVDSLASFEKAIAEGTPLEDLMSQGNHPNRSGHELVAREFNGWFPVPAQP